MSPEEILVMVLQAAASTGTEIIGIRSVDKRVFRSESVDIESRLHGSVSKVTRLSVKEMSELTVEQLSEAIDDS